MDFNKVFLAGKLVARVEQVKLGSGMGGKFELEYTNYKKVVSKFQVFVTNEKTVAFLMNDYIKPGIKLFVEGMLSATDGKPITIFASSVNKCGSAPYEKEAQKQNEVTITPDDFDSDDIPF